MRARLLALLLLPALSCQAAAQDDDSPDPYNPAPVYDSESSYVQPGSAKADFEERHAQDDPNNGDVVLPKEPTGKDSALGSKPGLTPNQLKAGQTGSSDDTQTEASPPCAGGPCDQKHLLPLQRAKAEHAAEIAQKTDNELAGNPLGLMPPVPGGDLGATAGGPFALMSDAGAGAVAAGGRSARSPRPGFVDDAVASNLERRAANAEASGNPARASLFNALAGRTDQADAQAQQALQRDPNDREALDALLLVKRSQGKADEARALARRALAADPKDRLAALVAGHDGLDKGEALRKKFAKLDLGTTAQTDGAGGGLQGLFGAAGTADAGERRLAAVGAAGAAAVGAPGAAAGGIGAPGGAGAGAVSGGDFTRGLTPAQQLVVRAVRKHEIGDDQGAMLALTQAVDQDPKEAAAYVVRAEVDNTLRKFTETIVDATKAVELAPTRPVLTGRALRARAYAQLELKQWVQALADSSGAVEQDPGNGLGYLYRALAEDKLGRGTAAADDVSRAVKLDPALTPLATPLLAKYNLSEGGSSAPARRSWPVLGAFAAVSAALLAFGSRRLFRSRGQTTTAPRAA